MTTTLYKIMHKDVREIRRALSAHAGGCWRQLRKEVGQRVVYGGAYDGRTSLNNLVVPVYGERAGGGYVDDTGAHFDTDLYDKFDLEWLHRHEIEMRENDPRIVLDVYLYYPDNDRIYGSNAGSLIGNAEVIFDTETGVATIGHVIADFG